MNDERHCEETKSDLEDAVIQIQQAHPSLPERLGQYRDKRATYEAKRLSVARTATEPAARGIHRDIRG